MQDKYEEPVNRFFYSNISPAEDNQVYLERPQIHRLLEQAVQSPLVTVVAGTGYGKTHSVYSFLRQYQGIAAWVQLSERDNNGWRFWENFLRAVAFIDKGSALKLAELGFPETKRQFDRYLMIPQENVVANKKYIFVYDDLHLIHEETVLRFLERSVTTSFSNITSILISRTEPPINTLGLFSKGLLAKITEDDLRFSREEMEAYLRQQDIHLSPDEALSLYHDTEGWVFAIYMACRSLKKGSAGTDHERSSMKTNVFKVIENEIFASISGDLQKYLIKLSLIDHLSMELLAELAAGTGLIEEMKKIGSFIRFDPYLNVLRIHHLFLEYLEAEQGKLSAEEKRDVYIKAARWCAANSQKVDAISYYEKAGAYDKLIDEVYTLSMVLPNHINTFLLNILDRAPQGMYAQNPAAHVLHTRLLYTQGRFGEAAAEAWGIIKKLEAQPPSVSNYRTLYGSYNNLGFIGMFACVFNQEYDFAAYFERAHAFYPLSAHELRGAVTVATLGSYVCRVGTPGKNNMEQFIDAVEASEPHITASMNGSTRGLTNLARTEFAYFKGDLINAEKFAYQSFYQAQQRNQHEIANRVLFYLLRLNVALGNYAKLRELFKMLEAQLEAPEYINRYVLHDIVSGWFFAHIGQSAKMAAWLKDDFEKSELNSLINGLEVLVRAKWYFCEKKYAEALNFLKTQENPYGPQVFLLGRLEMKILEAVCLYYGDAREESFKALEAAYDMAAANGLDMPFIEMGKDMRVLAGAALRDKECGIPRPWLEMILKNASAYAKKLFVVAETYQDQGRMSQKPEALLSSWEQEVLIGLSQGLTRKEIAEKNAISVNAIKSVIRSVYNKLEAVNRADAVRIATAMGILRGEQEQ
jgi:LuxR family maltose regulon positive regulatory protein